MNFIPSSNFDERFIFFPLIINEVKKTYASNPQISSRQTENIFTRSITIGLHNHYLSTILCCCSYLSFVTHTRSFQKKSSLLESDHFRWISPFESSDICLDIRMDRFISWIINCCSDLEKRINQCQAITSYASYRLFSGVLCVIAYSVLILLAWQSYNGVNRLSNSIRKKENAPRFEKTISKTTQWIIM